MHSSFLLCIFFCMYSVFHINTVIKHNNSMEVLLMNVDE